MPTEGQVVDAYTRRALQLLRVVNSLNGEVDTELTALAREIRGALAAGYAVNLGRRALGALLAEVQAMIDVRYAAIQDKQSSSLDDLTQIEAAWAQKASALPDAASATAIRQAMSQLLVQGLPLRRQWDRQAQNLLDRIAAIVRTAAAQGVDVTAMLAQVVGEGPASAGALGDAQAQARSLVDTATHTAAYAGRLATWKASGVNALKWHSILDSRTTVGCAVRAGLLYTLDFKPINHNVPIERPPPRHYNCRSILIPMHKDTLPADGQDPFGETFLQWLDRHSKAEQDAMLGAGRAELWREGKITLRDLIGQAGQELSLSDLWDMLGE